MQPAVHSSSEHRRKPECVRVQVTEEQKIADRDNLEFAVVRGLIPTITRDAWSDTGRGVRATVEQRVVAIVNVYDETQKDRKKREEERMKRAPKLSVDICPQCKNSKFLVYDAAEASTSCSMCAIVVQESQVHDGEWIRQFDDSSGTVLRQHGDPGNPLFSDTYNMRTSISITESTYDASKMLRRAQHNADQMERGESARAAPTTRNVYKEEQMIEVFRHLDGVIDKHGLSEPTRSLARTMFAEYRWKMEAVTNLSITEAACVIAAMRRHAETTQGPDFYFMCKVCNCRFATRSEARWHRC
jgi:hypothetical protein